MTILKKKQTKVTKSTLELEKRGKARKREIINNIRDIESIQDIKHYVHKGEEHANRSGY
jgi:hypothetical protein